MSTGLGPYVGTDASDTDDTGVGSPVIETTLTASVQPMVDIGGVTGKCGGLQRKDPRPHVPAQSSRQCRARNTATCRHGNQSSVPGMQHAESDLNRYTDPDWTSSVWQLSVGMFKTEVKESTLFSAAGAQSERYGDARNNLKPILEVVSPANSRTEQKSTCPLCVLGGSYLLTAVEDCF